MGYGFEIVFEPGFIRSFYVAVLDISKTSKTKFYKVPAARTPQFKCSTFMEIEPIYFGFFLENNGNMMSVINYLNVKLRTVFSKVGKKACPARTVHVTICMAFQLEPEPTRMWRSL